MQLLHAPELPELIRSEFEFPRLHGVGKELLEFLPAGGFRSVLVLPVLIDFGLLLFFLLFIFLGLPPGALLQEISEADQLDISFLRGAIPPERHRDLFTGLELAHRLDEFFPAGHVLVVDAGDDVADPQSGPGGRRICHHAEHLDTAVLAGFPELHAHDRTVGGGLSLLSGEACAGARAVLHRLPIFLVDADGNMTVLHQAGADVRVDSVRSAAAQDGRRLFRAIR